MKTGVIGTYSGVDIQFASPPSSDESKIRAWVLQNLPRHRPPLTRLR